jgi:hypothetical protein
MKSRDQAFGFFPLKLARQMVVERRINTYWIVIGFDVFEHRCFGVIEIQVAFEFGPFMLHRPEVTVSV